MREDSEEHDIEGKDDPGSSVNRVGVSRRKWQFLHQHFVLWT